MQFGDAAADRQAQAGAGVMLRVVQAFEHIEDGIELVGCNADAIVLHRQQDRAVHQMVGRCAPPAVRRAARTSDHWSPGSEVRCAAAWGRPKWLASGRRAVAQPCAPAPGGDRRAPGSQLVEVHRLGFGGIALQPHKLQQVVQQRLHALAAVVHKLQVAASTSRPGDGSVGRPAEPAKLLMVLIGSRRSCEMIWMKRSCASVRCSSRPRVLFSSSSRSLRRWMSSARTTTPNTSPSALRAGRKADPYVAGPAWES